MKKLILTIVLFVISLTSFSQARVNFTESEIRKEFNKSKFETSYTESGIKFIYQLDENVATYYYFNKESVCYMCMMIPLKQGTLNYFVEDYNSKYVIVSDTEWKFYNKNGIMYISLIEVKGNPAFIYYTKSSSSNDNNTNQN
jgi:hypothetical protein